MEQEGNVTTKDSYLSFLVIWEQPFDPVNQNFEYCIQYLSSSLLLSRCNVPSIFFRAICVAGHSTSIFDKSGRIHLHW